MSGIVVVEDELLVAEDLRQTLVDFGYQVAAVFSSGDEAVTRLAALEPELVLMDILLGPGPDGVEVVERVRRQIDLPVIYLSANADGATCERARKTAPLGYIPKPFSVTQLHQTIELVLCARRLDLCARENAERYRFLFERAPIGICEADCSVLKEYLDDRRRSGVADFRSLFTGSGDEVRHCLSLVRISGVNRELVRMYAAPDKQALLSGLARVLPGCSLDGVGEVLIALAEGELIVENELVNHTLEGEPLRVRLSLGIPSGDAGSWNRVLIFFDDIQRGSREEMMAWKSSLEAGDIFGPAASQAAG